MEICCGQIVLCHVIFPPSRLVDLLDIVEVVGGTIDEEDKAAILETISS